MSTLVDAIADIIELSIKYLLNVIKQTEGNCFFLHIWLQIRYKNKIIFVLWIVGG